MSALINQKKIKHGCGGCALAVLLLVIGLVAFVVYNGRKNKAEWDARFSRVSAHQLMFTDLHLNPIGRTYGSSYKLTGRVKNNSSFGVSRIRAKIRILDCDAQSHCDVVGEKHLLSLIDFHGIPSGQVRDIDESVYFGSATHIHGRFQWDYQITEIEAHK